MKILSGTRWLTLTVIAAVAVLSVIVPISLSRTRQHQSCMWVANLSLSQFEVMLEGYVRDKGALPPEETGLDELLLQYCKRSARSDYQRDPWGTPYRYEVKASHYLFRSAGPDGAFGTPDDIKSGIQANNNLNVIENGAPFSTR